jgi:hypothetical protein
MSKSKKASRRFMNEWFLLFLLVLISNSLPGSVFGQSTPNLTLSDIVANVRASEELYKDIEIKQTYKYKQLPIRLTVPKMNMSSSGNTRAIFKNDMFYLSIDETIKTIENEEFNSKLIGAYDGKKSKYVLDDWTGYEVPEKYKERRFYAIPPHNLLLKNLPGNIFADLSAILSGTVTLKTSPGAASQNVKLELEKFESFCGSNCAVIKAVFWSDAFKGTLDLGQCTRFWLALDYNFLPVKIGHYSSRFGDVPAQVGTVEEMKEIAPGLHYPFRSKFVCYNTLDGLKDNRFLPSSEYTFSTESVKLAPKYDKEFFSNAIKFSDDIRIVYMSQGKVIGARPRSQASTTSRVNNKSLIILVASTSFLILCSAIIYKKSLRYKK